MSLTMTTTGAMMALAWLMLAASRWAQTDVPRDLDRTFGCGRCRC
ncbi:hypothetical protein I552_0028 [Mycobacterium xenopi 3993]|nr:hypothetical protein I552_0028 [Mycobacterium xenopi 3993]